MVCPKKRILLIIIFSLAFLICTSSGLLPNLVGITNTSISVNTGILAPIVIGSNTVANTTTSQNQTNLSNLTSANATSPPEPIFPAINSTNLPINNTNCCTIPKEVKMDSNPFMQSYFGLLFDQNTASQQKKMVSQVIGVAAASSVGAKFMSPLAGFFQEFMFYGYHRRVYPDTVEMIVNQLDILAFMKIKPSFMNFQFQASFLSQRNQLYLNISQYIADRAPSTIYFTQTLNEVYLGNFILTVASYGLFCVLSKAFELTKQCKICKKMRCYLYVRAAFWSFVAALIGPNIRTLTYFSFAQLITSSSYQFSDKMNLLATIFVFAIVLFYTFVFNFILYQFATKSISQDLAQVGNHSMHAFTMSLALNCARGFLQGFVHAACTADNYLQIAGLIVIDLLSILVVFKLRNYFDSCVQFLFSLMYFVVFLTFNLFLAIYVFQIVPTLDFDFIFMTIIFVLAGVVLVPIIYDIIATFYTIIRRKCRNNKVMPSQAQNSKRKVLNSLIYNQNFKSRQLHNNSTLNELESRQSKLWIEKLESKIFRRHFPVKIKKEKKKFVKFEFKKNFADQINVNKLDYFN